MQQEFEQVWQQLRNAARGFDPYLDRLNIRNLRGLDDITFEFSFPVTVIAGTNGSGKTTALLAAAAAYAGSSDAFPCGPKHLFTKYKQPQTEFIDDIGSAHLHYTYRSGRQTVLSEWYHDGDWTNIRTPASQETSPTASQVVLRHYPQLGPPEYATLKKSDAARFLAQKTQSPDLFSRSLIDHVEMDNEEKIISLDSEFISFIGLFMPGEYLSVSFAEGEWLVRPLVAEVRRADGVTIKYSEYHMAAGERAIIHLVRDLGAHTNALVLIDEVEAGLHPHLQRLLMLELQRLALRRKLQIIVTTHSPVIIDSVPEDARIFLHRGPDGQVAIQEWRDVIERTLYGQPLRRAALICEDLAAKSVIQGVMDHVLPREDILHEQIDIGHDTGKDAFPNHLQTMLLMGLTKNCLFILDGDAQKVKIKMIAMDEKVHVLLLPGDGPPEEWAWSDLMRHLDRHAEALRLDAGRLRAEMDRLDKLFRLSTDKKSEIVKRRWLDLATNLGREKNEMLRQVAATATRYHHGDMQLFVENLVAKLRIALNRNR